MILDVKIPVGLPTRVVADRDLHGEKKKYRTNRMIKLADTYLVLKALSTSGKFQHWKGQADILADRCKISEWTLRNRVKEMITLGLIAFSESEQWTGCMQMVQDLNLCNWTKFLEVFLIDGRNLDFHNIAYDTDKTTQTLEYHIRALEFQENRYSQLNAIRVKLQKNPESYQQLCQLLLKHVPGCTPEELKDEEKFAIRLFWLQQNAFKVWPVASSPGSKYAYELINCVNACLDRSAKGIRKSHNLKSCLSTTYLKRQLKRRGLMEIKHHPALISLDRNRKSSDYTTSYDGLRKCTKWHLPASVTPVPTSPQRPSKAA